uniref:Metaxin 3 n=1 Tax=Salmo trutta TaxID=8032 RepID=A0A674BG30_SALTR
MAASMELRCWGGDWGLPSVHTESLIVFTPIEWTWRTWTKETELCCTNTITEPAQILNFLRKQELLTRQGAGTMAYIALLEEKLRPALLHTFWVDSENYANLTRPWFASRSPFRHNFLVPCRHANMALSRILLTKGDSPLHTITEVEGKIYSEAKECLNLLSHRLETDYYFFGTREPSSLDAFVFGSVALLHKASLPSSPLQSYFRQLDNLQRFCDHILDAHFSSHPGETSILYRV